MAKKTMNSQIKESLSGIFTKRFILYLIFMTSFFLLYYFFSMKTIKVFSLFGIAVTQIVYSIHGKSDPFVSRVFDWVYAVFLVFFSFIYLASAVGDTTLAVFALLFFFFLILLGGSIGWALKLWSSNGVGWIFAAYVILTINVVFLFSFLFIFASGFEGNGLKKIDSSNNSLSPLDYGYFTASLFYSNTFGDVVPQGFSRGIALLELFSSVVIHVFILQRVFDRTNVKYE